MKSAENNARMQRWLRFIAGGCVNTAFTYAAYLALIHFIEYQWAYFIVYALGIIFAYCVNASFVFRVTWSWKGFFIYPLVYVIQYGISAVALRSLVELLRISEALAPLLILLAMVPITYAMSKWVIAFTHTHSGRQWDHDRIKKLPVLAALTLPVIITIIAIWVPFGFSLIGLIEEWGILRTFLSHGLYFIATPEGPLADQALRPLTILPHAIAYLLDPNSFDYWNILLMLALLIKGSAASHLIWKATGSLRWAMVMGILMLVYPADTMQFSFRCLHINWALALLLLASSVFVVAYEHRRAVISYSLAFVSAALFLAACCMYEAALTLTLLPLFIPFVREGWKAAWNQFKGRAGLVAIWLAGAGMYLGYVMVTSFKLSESYQGNIVGNPIAALLHNLPKLFSIGALRSLLGGWFDAVRMVSTEFSGYVYLVLATAVISIACVFISKQKSSPISNAKWLPLRLGAIGLLLMLLGYLPFLVNGYFLNLSQRTFFWSTPGAAIAWIALLIVVSRFTKWFSWLATLSLVFFGLGAQLFQFHYYVQRSQTQRSLLRSIVENFDGNLGDKTLLILDKSNQLGHLWSLPKEYLASALSYIYGHPLNSVEICHMSDSTPMIVDKDQIITFSINCDGTATQNPNLDEYREKLLKTDQVAALRYRGILKKRVSLFTFAFFKDQQPKDRYRWSFGNWWSFDLPVRGAGWHGAEWTVNKFYHQSWARKKQEKSTLYFDLNPTQSHYMLRGRIRKIKEPVRQSLQIFLNRVELSCRWISDEEFEAEIQPEILLSGANEIAFNTSDAAAHSLKLAWFEVYPK